MSEIRETVKGITFGLIILTAIGVGAWGLTEADRRDRKVREAHEYCDCVPPEQWNEHQITPLSSETRYSCQEVDDLYHRLIK